MKKLFLLSVLMLLPMLASADAVEINGIYYFLRGDIAEVTWTPNHGEYSGSIVIPESVVYEGKTYSVTSIGIAAFSDCIGLTSVTIPNSVTSIGSGAFSGCIGLTSVTIPNRVSSIDFWAFSDCSGLTSVHITDIAAWCNINFGSNPLSYAHHLYLNGEEVKDLVIPNGVTSIGNEAFGGCSGLTSVTIPNSVTFIGGSAFSGCSGLTSLTIPNSVTSIGVGAFSGCSGLTSVTIGNSVTSIGAEAFNCCSSLTSVTIGNSVTTIGEMAFQSCIGLTSVTIPNSAKSIGECAFVDCRGLTEVISEIQNPFNIGDYVFYGISRNAILQVPKGTKSKYEIFPGWTKNFKEIVETEMNNTSTKRTIHVATAGTLPNLISEEEKYNIKELTLTGELNGTDFRLLRDMAGNNYLGQKTGGRLTVLDLSNTKIVAGGEKYLDTNTIKGNGVSNSGDFHYSILNNNVFPQSVFYACDLKIVNIPNSVTKIEGNAFYGCSGLTSVTIPNSVTYIGGWTFYNCSGLTSVTIPNSVTSIYGHAFEGCSSLTSVTIPNSVTYIDYAAFMRCSGLTSVTIPNNVTYIGNYAFSDCSGLTSIEVESGNSIYDSRDNCNAIIETSSNTLRAGCMNTIIPNSVTSIGREAFYGCSGLTSINIPNSVTSIGMYAFYKCNGLTSVTIPNSVTSIGLYAFWRCYGLTSVNIPNSVTSIGAQAFENCSGLTSLTIGNSVTYIGNWAFSGCSGLTSIEVESGNPNYDSRNNCNAIIETSSNTLINGCNNTIIPNSVASIGDYAFDNCSGLTSVTIPNSVTSIGNYTFRDCSGLTEVKSMIQKPYEISQNCWENVNTNVIPLYVPKGTKSLYEASAGWNVFKNIIEMDDNGNTEIVLSTEDVLKVGEVKTMPGKTVSFGISLDNKTTDLTAYQFDLTLPAGIELAKDARGRYQVTKTDRYMDDGQTLNISLVEGNTYRFVCFSLSNERIAGTDGAILDAVLSVGENVAADTYEAQITSITFTKVDGTQLKLNDAAFSIVVSDIAMGDANGDGEVNVSDIVEIVNDIMGRPSARFVRAAADLNGDGEVNVTDIVKLVSVIMNGGNARAKTYVQEDTDNDAVTLSMNADRTLSLDLENRGAYVASQFDLRLSGGMTLEGIMLNVGRSDGHQLAYARTGENLYRVIVYSTENRPYAGNGGELLNIRTSGSGEVTVDDILFITEHQAERRFAPLHGGTTGILTVEGSEAVDVYGLDGRQIRRQATTTDGLKKGIYVINGKKHVVR